jgi:FkbM family methyltransferase
MIADHETGRLWDGASLAEKGYFFEFIIEALLQAHCRPGDVALDVGGNYGAHTITMLHAVEESGQVHVFEPNPVLSAILKTWKHPQLTTYEVALSSVSGNAEFLVMQDPGGSRLSHGAPPNSNVTATITVPVKRLDDYGFPAIRLIKADVEGEEINFLEGALETLRATQPLVLMEFDWAAAFSDSKPAARAFLESMSESGFFVMDFFGQIMTRHDIDAWNIALVPKTLNFDSVARIVDTMHSAGKQFFSANRDWNPYQKMT